MESMWREHPDAAEGFRREAVFTLQADRDRVLHCLGQLSLDDLWWRPFSEANAVGNLVLHVCGNLTQWIVHGVGGEPDVRDRPGEFAHRKPIPGDELSAKLSETVDRAAAVIRAAGDGELLRPMFVRGGQCTGMGAIFHSVAHLEGHTQEIIYITRLRLGERYRYKDQH